MLLVDKQNGKVTWIFHSSLFTFHFSLFTLHSSLIGENFRQIPKAASP